MSFNDKFNNELFEEIMSSQVESTIIDADRNPNQINLNNKILNVLHLNIRSIRQNFNNLVTFLEGYKFHFCDVIILSECWLIGENEEFYIPGYTGHYNSSTFYKNDGVFMYAKSDLDFKITNFQILN